MKSNEWHVYELFNGFHQNKNDLMLSERLVVIVVVKQEFVNSSSILRQNTFLQCHFSSYYNNPGTESIVLHYFVSCKCAINSKRRKNDAHKMANTS